MNNVKRMIHYLLLILLTSCSYAPDGYPIGGQAYIVSVSTDGNYAVTSNAGEKIILWDIKNKKEKIISTNANIYSAYFIKNTHLFMWQDLRNIVHIQDLYGKEILSFQNFPTYGQVITSDLQNYYASDIDWNLYHNHSNDQKLVSKGYLSFIGAEKLLNLTLSNDNKFLLSSGYGGNWYGDTPLLNPKGKINLDEIVLWNSAPGDPISKFSGNEAKSIATMSPDGNYIVSGDENGRTFIWNTFSKKLIFKLDNDTYGNVICNTLPNKKLQCKMDFTGYPRMPRYLRNVYGNLSGLGDTVLSVKFIDLNDRYLRFTPASPYAVLYQINSPIPLKYLSLGKYPAQISHSPSFSRDEAIDTAPAANILVMAQADGPGIIVYKFDPKTLTLKKIWAPGADNWYFLKTATLWFLISLLLTFLFNLKRYPTIEKVILGTAIAIMLLAIFPLYTWGLSAGLFGVNIGIILNHKLRLLNFSLTNRQQ